MRCPVCGTAFDKAPDYSQGTHEEHTCAACGQLLQWDWAIQSERLVTRAGPPHPCGHADLRKLGALVPLSD
jgi:hypothetical protein